MLFHHLQTSYLVPRYLIPKAGLSLTHSLTHSVVPCPQSKAYSFSWNKRASLHQFTELPRWPSGLGVGLQNWWGRACRFDCSIGQFCLIFFLMMMLERCAAAQESANRKRWSEYESTKPERAKRPRMRLQSTKLEGAKRPRMRAWSDRVDVSEWAQQM